MIPNEILQTGEQLWLAESAGYREDELVVIHAQGRFRSALVLKINPKRTLVAYGTSGTRYREKVVAHNRVYAVSGPGEPVGRIRQTRSMSGGRVASGGQYIEEG